MLGEREDTSVELEPEKLPGLIRQGMLTNGIDDKFPCIKRPFEWTLLDKACAIAAEDAQYKPRRAIETPPPTV